MRSILLVLSAAAALAAAGPGSADPAAGSDCRSCHSCEKPSRDKPCLLACPRPRAPAARPSGPDTVTLNELEKIYDPVVFDHKAHSGMTKFGGDCSLCHHHTPTGNEHPACKSCHAPDIQHEGLDQPGLKGAYHRQCLGCHREWEGETSCEICHARKAVGGSPAATFHGKKEMLRMEDLIVFQTGYEEGDRVPFHHKNHSARYESDCTACHKDQSCTGCHTQSHAPHPMGSLDQVDLHDKCFECHQDDGGTSHASGDCDHCHGRAETDLFRHETTGWKLRAYHEDLGCRACHPPWNAPIHLESRCESCHPAGWDAKTFDHAVTTVTLDDTHGELDCTDCHPREWGRDRSASCDDCHDDGRRFDPERGFSP